MIKLEFFFGIGEDSNGKPLYASDVVSGKEALLRHVSYLAGGCSLVPHTGAWLDTNNKLVTEPGYTLVVVTMTPSITQGIAEHIKTTFNQKSVLVVQSEVSSDFI